MTADEQTRNEIADEAPQERLEQPSPADRAMAAFDAGDYRRVRELLPELARHEDERSRQTAERLTRAVKFDPVAAVVLLLCAVLFFAVATVYVLR